MTKLVSFETNRQYLIEFQEDIKKNLINIKKL